MSAWTTADLSDAHPDTVVVPVVLRDFGGLRSFAGPAFTVKVYEDNSLVRSALETEGDGSVLVVDGGGSLRCALVGDRLAELARRNGWAGLVVWGAVRDSSALASMPIGIKALGTCPRRSVKRNEGMADLPVSIGGAICEPRAWIYADPDGVLLAGGRLH